MSTSVVADIVNRIEKSLVLTPEGGWVEKGGPGSGHHRHRGVKGKRGGSVPSKGGVSLEPFQLSQESFKTDTERTTSEVREGASKRLAKRWDIDQAALDVFMKEEGLEFYGNVSEVKEQVAYDLLHRWAGSAGGPVPTAMAAHISDKLGMSYNLTPRLADTTQYIKDRPALNRAVTSLADAMYLGTQGWLGERGIASVELLRSGAQGKDRPHTSWSTDWGGVRHQPGRKVVTEAIPARYILSVPSTGFGTLSESEVVVLARP